MQISGCSAIVTGGTGGMGEATVRRLHAAGARVVVADVADEKGKALEQELGVRYVHVDAGSEADVLAAIAEAEAMAPLRISVDAHGGPAAGGDCWARTGARWGLTASPDHDRVVPGQLLQRDAAGGGGYRPVGADRGRRAGGHHQHRVDRRL
jgi:NAD(P)-dependent dehydrogenase (short-subunit alcohol dehydrogenase family)